MSNPAPSKPTDPTATLSGIVIGGMRLDRITPATIDGMCQTR